MVAVTKKIPYDELINNFDKNKDKIAIFTCNTCVRMVNETGGADEMEALSDRLEKDGFTVSERVVLTAACFEDYIEVAPLGEEWTIGLVLACDSGLGIVREFLKNTKKPIIPGVVTLGVQEGRTPKPVVLLEEK